MTLRTPNSGGHVARPHAQPEQPRTRPSDLLAQLAEGQLARLARLRHGDEGDIVGILRAPEHVLGVVEARAREPHRPREVARREHALVRLVCLNREKVPERAPEGLELVDRPAPELVVAGEVERPLALQPAEVTRKLRVLARIRRRRPEDVSLRRQGNARHD